MSQPTAGAAFTAASVLFNLPEYEVLEVIRDQEVGRRVVIATAVAEAACPDCGVLTARVHQRTRQRVADVGFDGHVEVVWVKKRWACAEQLCARRSFTEHTTQVPPRARLTQRLKDAIVEAVAGEVIDVVDGRDAAAVANWLAAQPRWWRRRVQMVAIDPSASFRSAVRRWLPKARVAVDHFHLVKLGNDMLTGVRRRVSWDRHDRRGRTNDLAWAHRLLLLRGYNTLSPRGRAKLNDVMRTDDPTDEIGAAWGIKEQLRLTLMSTTLSQARERKATFDRYVAWAKLTEAGRLKKTIDGWWTEIETFIETRVTNARTEAANVAIKNIKRTGRGYRSHANYQSRIMLYNAARSAA